MKQHNKRLLNEETISRRNPGRSRNKGTELEVRQCLHICRAARSWDWRGIINREIPGEDKDGVKENKPSQMSMLKYFQGRQ